MLKTLRKNTKIVIWSVILCFALWGGFSVGTQFQKQGRVAGEVFGKEITFQEYNSFYRSAQIFTLKGQNNKPTEAQIRNQAWQNIILNREAMRRNIKVTDDEVRNEIFGLLAQEGLTNPEPEVYRRWTEQTLRESPQQFEAQIRNVLRIQKLVREVLAQPLPVPTEEEARNFFLLETRTIQAEGVPFSNQKDAETFAAKIKNKDSWNKETAAYPDRVKKSSAATRLREWMILWGLKQDAAAQLFETPAGQISKPLAITGGHAVFFMIAKQEADQTKFQKEDYLKTLADYQKRRYFLEWNMDLYQRAGLKSYLPALPDSPSSAPTAP